MAEVISADHHARHPSSMGPIALSAAPEIEMVSNPDFSFPAVPAQKMWPARQSSGGESVRRPASAQMHIDIPQSQNMLNSHRRTASTLPSFTFNSNDASGLTEARTPPRTPDENAASTPSRHRRGGSEFVGGDSRLGVTQAVSTSPSKVAVTPLPGPTMGPPAGRRGHAHRRSAAISSHDIGNLMQPPTIGQPRLSSSLPTTPLEQPEGPPILRPDSANPVKRDESDPFGPPLDNPQQRPTSRPRVGFSDNVEYIPRPLSTISSETESSVSTKREHSVNNSISSMLSMVAASPPSSRVQRSSRSSTLEDDPKAKTLSSVDTDMPKSEKVDGRKNPSVEELSTSMPLSAGTPARTTFALPIPSERPTSSHKKQHAHSHAFGFDRRKSEPTIGMTANDMSRLSAISLHSSASFDSSQAAVQNEHKSSTRRIKDWAVSKISRKSKEGHKVLTAENSAGSMRPDSAGSTSMSAKAPVSDRPVAETNLDAVFGSQEEADDSERPATPVQTRLSFNAPPSTQRRSFQSLDSEEATSMLDLDTALGPLQSPALTSFRHRKELHSSRLAKDFNGPGGHYHRRAESDPTLPSFHDGRSGGTLKPEMADVFEEDEDDSTVLVPSTAPASMDSGDQEHNRFETGFIDKSTSTRRAVHGSTAGDRPVTQVSRETARSNVPSALAAPWFPYQTVEGRSSSIIDEPIVEEPVLMEGLEIVEAHEEPRAPSLTKSSVSSDTPTLLVAPPNIFTIPADQRAQSIASTSETSSFPSPDLRPRQGSFDVSDHGTSASSIADNRTISSSMTGDHGQDLRVSVDDVPSLTSSRSSAICANGSRRDFGSGGYPSPVPRVPYIDPAVAVENRRKRGSIQSLSQLVGGSFGSKHKGVDESRPQTSEEPGTAKPSKKEHRLKKLMFWKSKQPVKKPADNNS